MLRSEAPFYKEDNVQGPHASLGKSYDTQPSTSHKNHGLNYVSSLWQMLFARLTTIKKDDIPSVPAYHALIPVILSYHGSDVLLTIQLQTS